MKTTALTLAVTLLAVPALANPCGTGGSKAPTVINYETGVTTLSKADKAKLAEWAETAKFRQVCIFAQVDKQGSEAANEKVAEGRANNARDYLIAQGVPADSISVATQDEAFTFFGLLPTDQDDDRRITLTHN